MLRLKLHDLTDEYVEYKFYPEQEDCFGIVGMTLKDKKLYYPKFLSEEYGDYYQMHAYFALRDFVEENSFPQTGTRCWY